MPIWPGIAGWSSMFILTSLTLPLAARTAFSMIGVSWRQGPHHGAQKSISTGWRLDSSITSFTKVCVVVSLMRSDAVCGAGPPPCSSIVTCPSPDVPINSSNAPILARPGPLNGPRELQICNPLEPTLVRYPTASPVLLSSRRFPILAGFGRIFRQTPMIIAANAGIGRPAVAFVGRIWHSSARCRRTHRRQLLWVRV